jgi:sporulation protein YlmC with PRC-barrel domain
MPLIALFTAFIFAAVAQAAEPRPLSRTVEKWQDKRASELIGAAAVDRRHERLGRIDDLIISSQTGAVHYAVVSFGGYLGLGDRQYIYPVQALAPGRTPREVAIDVDRKDLGERTGVEELESWLREYDPAANVADRRFVRASELIGKPVAQRSGERLGEVEDLVVNLGSGGVRFVVVEMAERVLALPLDALNVPILTDHPLSLRLDAPSGSAATGSGAPTGR